MVQSTISPRQYAPIPWRFDHHLVLSSVGIVGNEKQKGIEKGKSERNRLRYLIDVNLSITSMLVDG